MQKADASTLPQALRSGSKKARRLGPRRDRRGHRAAGRVSCSSRTRAGQLLPPLAASSTQLHAGRCSCRNDAGSSVVTGPLTTRSTHARLGLARREQHDRARVQDRRHPHRERLGRHACSASPPKSAALLRRVSGLSVTRCVRDWSSRAGSLNPMWPLVPMPRICRSMPPASLDRALVARALRVRILRRAVQEVRCGPVDMFTRLKRCSLHEACGSCRDAPPRRRGTRRG